MLNYMVLITIDSNDAPVTQFLNRNRKDDAILYLWRLLYLSN